MIGLHTAITAGHLSSGESVLFWVIAPITVLAALGLLFARKAVHAALSMIVVMISLAVLYVTQSAPFLGIVQVVVYTGAVMMLFLFVIMLVGVDASDSLVETLRGQRWIAAIAGIGTAVVLVGVVLRSTIPTAVGLADTESTNPEGVAHIIFGDFILTFEVVGVLLVTAALGALVLSHRRRLTPRRGQAEMADARISSGGRITPHPAPGVYAQHNAMDVPAIDATGRPLLDSISRVLRVRGQAADEEGFLRRIETFARQARADETINSAAAPTEIVAAPEEMAAAPADSASGPVADDVAETAAEPTAGTTPASTTGEQS